MNLKTPSPKIISIPDDFSIDPLKTNLDQDVVFTLPPLDLPTAFIDRYQSFIEQIASPDYSRVLVVAREEMHRFSEHVNVVPSLQEAYDIIEMERIERDLGV